MGFQRMIITYTGRSCLLVKNVANLTIDLRPQEVSSNVEHGTTM